jgi:hypothetical protein
MELLKREYFYNNSVSVGGGGGVSGRNKIGYG